MPNKNEKKTMEKEVKIKRIYPDELSTHFVSNLVVQHQPDFFILSFFEIWPPAILGKTEKEKKAQLEAIDHIDAKCISRIVLTPEKMKEFANVINDNLKNYEIMMKAQS